MNDATPSSRRIALPTPKLSSIIKHAPLLLLWMGGVVGIALAGFIPISFLGEGEAHDYPTDGVTTIVFAITLEIAILIAILRPRSFRRSWIRALCAFLVTFVFLFFSVAAIMDAPFYALLYAKWAFLVFLLVFLLAAWTTVASAFAWVSRRKVPAVR